MNFSVRSSFLFILIIFPLFQLCKFVDAKEARHEECKVPIQCGKINLSYPFYDDKNRPAYCGHPGFKVYCSDEHNMPEISVTTESSEIFYLLGVSPDSHTISVAREDYWNGFCPQKLSNTNLNFNLFNYTSADENVTLYYECSAAMPVPGYLFSCKNLTNSAGYLMTRDAESSLGNITPDICKRNISIPVYQSLAANITDISSSQATIRGGFELEWFANNELCDSCRVSGGECGYNTSMKTFTCYCTNDFHDARCDGNSSTTKKSVVIGVSVAGAVVAAALLACGSIFIVRRRKQSRALSESQSKELESSNLATAQTSTNGYHSSYTTTTSYPSQSIPSYPSSKSDFEKSADYLGVKVFNYNELEQATENFNESRELGDGGFGTVYYGMINTDRVYNILPQLSSYVRRPSQLKV